MFRQMSKEQQLFAKKGIDELLMKGQLNMLTYQGLSSIARLPNKPDYCTGPVYQMPVPAYPRQKIYVSTPTASDLWTGEYEAILFEMWEEYLEAMRSSQKNFHIFQIMAEKLCSKDGRKIAGRRKWTSIRFL